MVHKFISYTRTNKFFFCFRYTYGNPQIHVFKIICNFPEKHMCILYLVYKNCWIGIYALLVDGELHCILCVGFLRLPDVPPSTNTFSFNREIICGQSDVSLLSASFHPHVGMFYFSANHMNMSAQHFCGGKRSRWRRRSTWTLLLATM